MDLARYKLKNILSTNCRYSTSKKIYSIINGVVKECDEDEELSVEDLSNFKYAPIVSCDVELSFSKYKSMLRDIVGILNSKTWNRFLLLHVGTRPIIIIE